MKSISWLWNSDKFWILPHAQKKILNDFLIYVKLQSGVFLNVPMTKKCQRALSPLTKGGPVFHIVKEISQEALRELDQL